MVLSESFLSEVINPHVPQGKRYQTKCKQFAAHISLDKKLEDWSRALHSSFALFYTIKAPNGKLAAFRQFFQPPHTEPERPS